MATDSPDATTVPERQHWARTARIVAVFAALGPLVGALSAVLLIVAVALCAELLQERPDSVGHVLGGGLSATLLAAVPVAYAVGGIPSIAVGLVVAMQDRQQGAVTMRTALTAAVILALVMAACAAFVIPAAGLPIWLAGLFVAHVAAAWICTNVARRVALARRPSGPNTP